MNAGLGHCLAEEAATARLRAGWGGRKATLRVAKGPWHELGRGGQKYGGRRGGFELGSYAQHHIRKLLRDQLAPTLGAVAGDMPCSAALRVGDLRSHALQQTPTAGPQLTDT